MLPVDQVVFTPSVTAPTGVNTRTVCEMLGWTVDQLFGHVGRGSLPPPDWFGGEMLWPIKYTLDVKANGLRLPGTFPGWLPGTDVEAERRRWVRRTRGRELRYGAKVKRERARAAKKGGRK